jgi:osmoprotectant transport system permease protein
MSDTLEGAATATEAPTLQRRRMSTEQAIEIFAIPVIVVVGFALYAWWRNTASLDSVEQSSLEWAAVWLALGEHVKLTLVSAVIVVFVGVPLGVLLTRPRYRAAAPAVVGIANAGQAAPAIGLIVLLFIWLSGQGWFLSISTATGKIPFLPDTVGFNVAVIALSLYAILPVLRKTITGLQGIDPTLVEAGRGVGMSNFAVLRRVELPLAIPVIMAGIRTALVLLVGTAALATFINAGGRGGVLTAGITLYRYPVMVAGAVLVALLALLIEWVGRVLELIAKPKGI